MRSAIGNLAREVGGAVAPTVALSLFGLIAAGGVAFDYARMAAMDTELQNAADQAALAAASQLDGETGACARAASAAANMVSHSTLFANDSGGIAINVQNESACDATGRVRFWQDIGKTTPASNDSNAKFVEVEVDPRTARFALTPVVGALSSGPMTGIAFAGLDSAICKVPPLMLCNPAESSDPDFTIANYIGKGIRLVANDGGGIYGPGNFGFLDTGAGNGAATLRMVLGRSNVPGDCASGDGVTTQTGSIITVRDALNARFDVFDQGLNQACGATGSLCPPSLNTRKDLVQKGGACGFATGNGAGWKEAGNVYPGLLNLPGSTSAQTPHALSSAEMTPADLAPMGYPRDICHAFGTNNNTGSCSPVSGGVGSRVGDGNWDRFAYFRSNPAEYPTITTVSAMNQFLATTFGTTTPSRYRVYAWEMANAADRLHTNIPAGSGVTVSGQPVCSPPGLMPSTTQTDRRVISAAVVNCTAEDVGGHTIGVHVTKWIDMFLVEPSVPRMRTENSDVYIEVIGQTQNATDEGAVQLVKKSVPYLIE
ncbi:MAG TPA: pilus assembly protein TadG-related protein [Sphingomicrobium sp.]